MRITFLTQWFHPEIPSLLALARALTRRGFDVEVLTGFPNYPTGVLYPGYHLKTWQREVLSGVPVVRVPLYPSHDRNAVRRIANYASFAASAATLGPLLARRSDALYVYPPPTVAGAAAVFRRAWGIPMLYHITDMWPESVTESGMLGAGRARQAVSFLLDRYCRWIYSHSDVITVASPGFVRLLSTRGVDLRKVHVVHNWIDEEVFRPVKRDPRLAKDLGMAGRFNVVYAGNMGPFQGLDSVLQAALLLRDQTDIQFVMVGTGTEEARLRELAGRMGVGNVRFLSQRPASEMPAINALADVLLIHLRDLPFFRATTPGKTQAALACGRPVVMAVAGDAAAIVTQAGAGATVPPENPAALAEAVKRMRDLPVDERERMGSRGRDYYLKEMSLDVSSDRIASLLRDMVGRTRSAGTRSGV